MLTGKYSVTGIIIDSNAFMFRVKQYNSQHHIKLERTEFSVTPL